MNIDFKVVNHTANLNSTLSFDSSGYNILTNFMNCNKPPRLTPSGIIAFINFVCISYPRNQSYCVLFTNYSPVAEAHFLLKVGNVSRKSFLC